MNKIVFISLFALMLLATPVLAGTHHVIINNNTTVMQNTDNYEAFDYGTYLDLIVLETPKTEWGFKTTWLQESQEARVYVGGKIYLNKLVKK
jgi:hypothetical protein